MTDIMRDPLWQFVGAMLALVALAAVFIIAILQRKRKRLSYEIMAQTSVLAVKEELRKRVQILFDGSPVTDAEMLVLRIVNTGNIPVLASDYIRPVCFRLAEPARVLTAEVLETNPAGIDAAVSQPDVSSIALAPTLLNPRDSVVVKLLVAGHHAEVTVDARVVGVRSIEVLGESPWRPLLSLLGLLFLGAGIVLVRKNMFLGIILITIGYGLAVVPALSRRRLRRQLLSAMRGIWPWG